MTLLALMFHRASAGRHGNPAAMLDAHFELLSRDFHCVLPGEPLDDARTNVCLTFDDGYVDFYGVVYPLLRKHGLRAVLAVPVLSIREAVAMPLEARLKACESRLDEDACEAYCAWSELGEMVDSGSIQVASHGFSHVRLDDPDVNLHTEIAVSRTFIAARVGRPVDTFVLPYGRFSPEAIELAKRHYRYVFRIGSADNGSWNGRVLYRVDADEMATPNALLSLRRLTTYRLRRQWNRLRAR